MRSEYASMVATEEEKCTEDQEIDLQIAALTRGLLVEAVLEDRS